MAVPTFHNADALYTFEKLARQPAIWWRPSRTVDYSFSPHYHPYTDELIEKLNRNGLPALLDPDYQASLERPLAPAVYLPGPYVTGPFPKHEIDVSDDGAYAIYNWELFFHAPVIIA